MIAFIIVIFFITDRLNLKINKIDEYALNFAG